MSETMNTADHGDHRDQRGRFLSGGKPGPGRAKGSRNRLAESFVADLYNVWEAHGASALERCAIEEPAQFVRVVASLMPKDINLSVEIDPASFVSRFHTAAQLLGHDVEPPRPRRPLRVVAAKVIDHAG
jgi:hypothetical protein